MPWKPTEDFDPETQTFVIGHPTEDMRIEIAPMIFNDRITVTRLSDYPRSVVAGFCYDRGLATPYAYHWLANWDSMDVPNGYKKVAFNVLPTYGKGKR